MASSAETSVRGRLDAMDSDSARIEWLVGEVLIARVQAEDAERDAERERNDRIVYETHLRDALDIGNGPLELSCLQPREPQAGANPKSPHAGEADA